MKTVSLKDRLSSLAMQNN